jgi:hypothetical protein
MDRFESTGYWYLPTKPEHQVVGTLRHDKDGLHLSLTGGFSEFTIGSFEIQKYPLIHGVVDEHPAGKFVTLINSLLVSQKIRMPGASTQIIRAESALVGHALLNAADLKFTECQVRFSHLEDWFEPLKFSDEFVSEEEKVVGYKASYEKPPVLHFRLDERSFRFASAFLLSKDARSLTIRDELYVISEDFEPLDLDQLTREIVRPIQELISFATNTANSILHLAVWNRAIDAREHWTRFSVFRQHIVDPQENLDRLDRDEMLFSYRDALDSGCDLFDAWGRFRSKFRAFCLTYFPHQNAPLTFQEDRFLRIVRELQLFFRLAGLRAYDDFDVQQWVDTLSPDSTTEQQRRWLAAVVPDKSDLGLPWNVLQALEHNGTIVAPLMNKEPTAFVDQVLDSLVYVLRGDNDEESANLRGERLYFLTERLSMLLKVCILRQLGFQPDWIRQVISQNSKINVLKTIGDS